MSVYNMRSPVNPCQTIEFNEDDADTTVEVFGNDVTVVCGSGGGSPHPLASSKVRLNNIVDYCWEERFHLGQLLAVHMDAKFIAYAIKAMGKTHSVIRILNRDTGERGLIKSVDGMVEDLAFARLPLPHVILASVDHHGTLLVHQITELDSEIGTTLLLHVNQSKEVPIGLPHRVFWCSYIPEEDGGQDAYYDEISRLLAVTRNNKIEMWNVGIVSENHGSGPFVAGDVDEGYLEIEAHSNLIVDAAFSPDGTAIATASLDGDCKFYQVYMQAAGSSTSGGGTGVSDPRCLHQWQPHGGKPLSALFFLDDHRNYNPDVQFWKFAVTGADNNTELKLWSCETWKCLQTIRFTCRTPPPPPTKLKASMDLSAGYILMTDLYHRLLYVLELKKENNETFPFVRSLTEFKLPCPVISFGVVDAGPRTFKTNAQPFMLEDLCTGQDGDEDTSSGGYGTAVVVRMYIVQPKSFQECHIVFQTPQVTNRHHRTNNHVQQRLEPVIYQDGELTDMELPMKDSIDLMDQPLPVQAQQPEHCINLMTPDAFSSPLKQTSPVIGRGDSTTPIADNTITNFGNVNIPGSPANDSTAVMCFTSGGSSPSREVQEIMSLQDSPCYYMEGADTASEVDGGLPVEASVNLGVEVPCTSSGGGNNDWRPLPQVPPLPQASKWCVNLIPKSPEITKLMTKSVGSGPEAGEYQQPPLQYASASSIEHLEAAMANMRMDLAAVVITIQEQSQQIQELKEELKRKDERTMVILEEATRQWLEAMRLEREEAEARRRLEVLPVPPPPPQVKCSLDQQVLAGSLSQVVADAAVIALNTELQVVIKPALMSTLSELKEMLSSEVSKKLTATDQLLKESVSKLVRNKHVLQAISNTLLANAAPAMADCYKEAFTQAVPMFERACDNMFKQMIATFTSGTEEYVKEIERYSERASVRSQEEIVAMRAASDSMSAATQQFISNIEKAGKKLEDSVLDAVTRGVRGSLNNGSIAAAVVRSRTVTPAPSAGTSTPHHVILDSQLVQSQLTHLITQGQFNSAFQQALSAADLSLVMYVCERVAPHQVFTSSGSMLQQHVLLSLIQQLSADMNHHTEIRHRYLEEAVMNLDPKNTATREHMPAVLTSLHKQLQLYISLHPATPITKRVRMLQMATQSLLT